MNQWGIHKVISRIKAEEQIWNKVVDSIFGFDQLVNADKQLRHLGGLRQRRLRRQGGGRRSRGGAGAARRAAEAAVAAGGAREARRPAAGSDVDASSSSRSRTTWPRSGGRRPAGRRSSRSSSWWDSTIEVQVQPLWNYHQEREYLTRESHAGFKERRETLRNQVADAHPAVRVLSRPAALAVPVAGRAGADLRGGGDRLRD